MKYFWGGILSLLLTVVLLLGGVVMASPAFAATTATVTVNATPTYVSVVNTPGGYPFGVVAISTNYSTTQGYFNITNGSSVNISIAISCNATWGGGAGWTHSDTGTPGVSTAALYCSSNTGLFNTIVKNGTPNNLVSDTGASNILWELRLRSPTEFGDAVLKSNTITLTATAS
jgi:hypothetical protein